MSPPVPPRLRPVWLPPLVMTLLVLILAVIVDTATGATIRGVEERKQDDDYTCGGFLSRSNGQLSLNMENTAPTKHVVLQDCVVSSPHSALVFDVQQSTKNKNVVPSSSSPSPVSISLLNVAMDLDSFRMVVGDDDRQNIKVTIVNSTIQTNQDALAITHNDYSSLRSSITSTSRKKKKKSVSNIDIIIVGSTISSGAHHVAAIYGVDRVENVNILVSASTLRSVWSSDVSPSFPLVASVRASVIHNCSLRADDGSLLELTRSSSTKQTSDTTYENGGILAFSASTVETDSSSPTTTTELVLVDSTAHLDRSSIEVKDATTPTSSHPTSEKRSLDVGLGVVGVSASSMSIVATNINVIVRDCVFYATLLSAEDTISINAINSSALHGISVLGVSSHSSHSSIYISVERTHFVTSIENGAGIDVLGHSATSIMGITAHAIAPEASAFISIEPDVQFSLMAVDGSSVKFAEGGRDTTTSAVAILGSAAFSADGRAAIQTALEGKISVHATLHNAILVLDAGTMLSGGGSIVICGLTTYSGATTALSASEAGGARASLLDFRSEVRVTLTVSHSSILMKSGAAQAVAIAGLASVGVAALPVPAASSIVSTNTQFTVCLNVSTIELNGHGAGSVAIGTFATSLPTTGDPIRFLVSPVGKCSSSVDAPRSFSTAPHDRAGFNSVSMKLPCGIDSPPKADTTSLQGRRFRRRAAALSVLTRTATLPAAADFDDELEFSETLTLKPPSTGQNETSNGTSTNEETSGNATFANETSRTKTLGNDTSANHMLTSPTRTASNDRGFTLTVSVIPSASSLATHTSTKRLTSTLTPSQTGDDANRTLKRKRSHTPTVTVSSSKGRTPSAGMESRTPSLSDSARKQVSVTTVPTATIVPAARIATPTRSLTFVPAARTATTAPTLSPTLAPRIPSVTAVSTRSPTLNDPSSCPLSSNSEECNAHGACVHPVGASVPNCLCDTNSTGNWSGPACEQFRTCPREGSDGLLCGGNGDCDLRTFNCSCHEGWAGEACEIEAAGTTSPPPPTPNPDVIVETICFNRTRYLNAPAPPPPRPDPLCTTIADAKFGGTSGRVIAIVLGVIVPFLLDTAFGKHRISPAVILFLAVFSMMFCQASIKLTILGLMTVQLVFFSAETVFTTGGRQMPQLVERILNVWMCICSVMVGLLTLFISYSNRTLSIDEASPPSSGFDAVGGPMWDVSFVGITTGLISVYSTLWLPLRFTTSSVGATTIVIADKVVVLLAIFGGSSGFGLSLVSTLINYSMEIIGLVCLVAILLISGIAMFVRKRLHPKALGGDVSIATSSGAAPSPYHSSGVAVDPAAQTPRRLKVPLLSSDESSTIDDSLMDVEMAPVSNVPEEEEFYGGYVDTGEFANNDACNTEHTSYASLRPSAWRYVQNAISQNFGDRLAELVGAKPDGSQEPYTPALSSLPCTIECCGKVLHTGGSIEQHLKNKHPRAAKLLRAGARVKGVKKDTLVWCSECMQMVDWNPDAIQNILTTLPRKLEFFRQEHRASCRMARLAESIASNNKSGGGSGGGPRPKFIVGTRELWLKQFFNQGTTRIICLANEDYGSGKSSSDLDTYDDDELPTELVTVEAVGANSNQDNADALMDEARRNMVVVWPDEAYSGSKVETAAGDESTHESDPYAAALNFLTIYAANNGFSPALQVFTTTPPGVPPSATTSTMAVENLKHRPPQHDHHHQASRPRSDSRSPSAAHSGSEPTTHSRGLSSAPLSSRDSGDAPHATSLSQDLLPPSVHISRRNGLSSSSDNNRPSTVAEMTGSANPLVELTTSTSSAASGIAPAPLPPPKPQTHRWESITVTPQQQGGASNRKRAETTNNVMTRTDGQFRSFTQATSSGGGGAGAPSS